MRGACYTTNLGQNGPGSNGKQKRLKEHIGINSNQPSAATFRDRAVKNPSCG